MKRVVYASSVAVYGRDSFKAKGPGAELDEDDPPDPMGFYGMDVHYMVLPELAAIGKPVEMPSDDSESDWIYAADTAEAWWRAMETPASPRLVYNRAAERRRMADVTAHLRKLLPEARIGVSDKRVPNIANMNRENLRKDLDFRSRYTMETGLTEYVNAVPKSPGLAPGSP